MQTWNMETTHSSGVTFTRPSTEGRWVVKVFVREVGLSMIGYLQTLEGMTPALLEEGEITDLFARTRMILRITHS